MKEFKKKSMLALELTLLIVHEYEQLENTEGKPRWPFKKFRGALF